MFWGLVLEPGKRYTQDEVEDSFHISMACIDPGTTNDGLTSLLVDYEGQEYVLCSLSKKGVMQQVLDLNFAKGDTLSFYTSGKSTVHLSGYLMLDDDMGDDTLGELMEEQEEEEDDEEAPELASNKRKNAKEQGKKAKKAKLGEEAEEEGEEEDDEEGDEEMSDFFDESGEEFDENEGEEEEEAEDEEEAKPQPKGKNKQQQQAAAKSPAKAQTTPAENGESPSKKKKNKKDKKAEAATQPAQQGTPQQQKQQQPQAKTPSKKTLPGGLIVEDLKEGTGPAANVGKHVSVYYSGRLPQSNKPFDSTLKGQGFRFKLGAGEVIKGWDQGLQGMKVGGKRRITVPASLGYGKKGSPPVIPPNSTLIFDVELKSVQ